MKKFITADRDLSLLMPYDLNEWVQGEHLARFIVDIVDQLNLSKLYNEYGGRGYAAYDPKLLLSLLFYAYSTGIFSSRKIEMATYDSVAFRFISGNHHPDHDTISNFRKRFLPEIKQLFKDILLIGKELGFVRIGNVYIDGTKVQANASKHKAMSYDYILRLEKQLETEIEKLLDLAEQNDNDPSISELDMPKEIQCRKDRLAKIKLAKEAIESRAKERCKREKEEYDLKMKERALKEEKTGKRAKGKEPKEPTEQPNKSDQYNFTDPESRIMKSSSGFDQCYNGQISVTDDMIIVGAYSNAHCNDKQEFIPSIDSVVPELGEITNAVADAGYFSEKNINDCKERGINSIIASSRERHNSFFEDMLNKAPESDENESIAVRNKSLIDDNSASIYRKRKHTVEPVFGIIKEVMGFRRFSVRGEAETNSEWALVCLAYNLKRFFKLKMA